MGVRELRMSLRWARLVHEKLAVIATFAYSQTALKEEIEKHFRGEWKFLHKIIYELPHEEATKALIELALYFRAFDDEQDLTGFWKQVGVSVVGSLVLKNREIQSLSPREMSNKIIHAEEIKWDFSEEQPRIICTGRNKEEWLRAIIDVWKMLWIGAQLEDDQDDANATMSAVAVAVAVAAEPAAEAAKQEDDENDDKYVS
jgi:hypothetical protein